MMALSLTAYLGHPVGGCALLLHAGRGLWYHSHSLPARPARLPLPYRDEWPKLTMPPRQGLINMKPAVPGGQAGSGRLTQGPGVQGRGCVATQAGAQAGLVNPTASNQPGHQLSRRLIGQVVKLEM